jgi:KDO2-lipid IV(A) lauroyltransferase
MIENAKKIFGTESKSEHELEQVAIQSVQSLILTALETLESRYVAIDRFCELRNAAAVENALKKAKGVFMLSTHTGNWEALAASVCNNLCQAYVPVKKVGGRQTHRYVTELRHKYGLYTAERKQKGDSFKIIKDMIESGKVVGFMQDQARPGSPRMPFFGHLAKTNTSMAEIYRRFEAPMFAISARRISPRHHVVEFSDELKLRQTEDQQSDIAYNIAVMNQMTERLIAANPSQSLLMHDRWK